MAEITELLPLLAAAAHGDNEPDARKITDGILLRFPLSKGFPVALWWFISRLGPSPLWT